MQNKNYFPLLLINRNIKLLMFSIIFSQHTFCQNIESIKRIVNEAQKGRLIAVDSAVNSASVVSNALEYLNYLRRYHTDSSSTARFASYLIESKIAQKNNDPTVRKLVVNSLANALSDKDPLVWQFAAKRLQTYRSASFSPESRASIVNAINNIPKREIILLAGTAQINVLNSTLQKIIKVNSANDSISSTGMWYGKLSWAAHLALARLGNKENIQYSIKRIESEKDEVLRVTYLLQDLAYIRQYEAVKVLQNYLESSKLLPPVDQGAPGTRYSDYALRQLSQIIEGFPLRYREVGYNIEEVEIARRWMKENSSYNILK